MQKISLRNIKQSDIRYFSKWWNDADLRAHTSGDFEHLSNAKIRKYFNTILTSEWDFIILSSNKVVGHIALAKRKNGWRETQIIIGEKKDRGKGYGSRAIQLMLRKASKKGIDKIYLEVRPNNIGAIKVYEKCGFLVTGVCNCPHNKNLPQTFRMELVASH